MRSWLWNCELSRVRSEIERMQGRLRALSNLTSLATVTVTASEIKGYVPPQAPTLATRISRTFAASLETLQQVGEGLVDRHRCHRAVAAVHRTGRGIIHLEVFRYGGAARVQSTARQSMSSLQSRS